MRKLSKTLAGVALMAAAGMVTGVLPTAMAAPQPGSPLIAGAFCDGSGAPISGTGASFAANAHALAFMPAYAAACGSGAGKVAYSATGSGAGKTAARTHDANFAFAGTDEPLDASELAVDTADSDQGRARVSPLHHIPIALGAITVSYNLGSCGIGQTALNLRSPQIAKIYEGVITRWNDPLLTLENPALGGCNKGIKVAARSDVSGTTFAFKDYLGKRNPEFNLWKTNDLNTAWPGQDLGLITILRGKGNGGVAAVVKATDGAIGYVDLSTAEANGLTYAKTDGASGVLNSPKAAAGNAANCDQAAVGTPTPASTLSPGWDAVSITDTPNPLAYAVCTFTYALVYNNLKTAFAGGVSAGQARTLVDYLGVALDDAGQSRLPAAGYARLPVNLQTIAKAGLASVGYL
ncbi:MAG: substrate-binding domain-containing protein [Microthrixaceae bacterium]